MNILHVVPSFYPAVVYGGTTWSVYALCQSLARQGCAVRALTTDANGPDRVLDVDTDRDVEVAAGVRVRYCHRLRSDSISMALLRLLPRYIRWADVVHLSAVYSFPTIPTLLACRLLRRPLMWSPRGMLQRWEGTTRPSLKAVWEVICRAVAPPRMALHATSSVEARETAARMPGIEVSIIPNGVDVPECAVRVNGHGGLQLVYLGRLHPKKGIENLVDGYALLSDEARMRVSLTIAGSGDSVYTRLLQDKIAAAGLSSSVRMIGEVRGRDKERLLQSADVVVVPSYTENFANVVAEALAHGVPVIASKGTPWERVEERGCGLWVDNAPESLADAITKMSRSALRQMGERGREWVAREFAWDSVAGDMITAYQGLLARR